ncbi:uncharacterized protein N7469_002313 [Penicillium citrinum]|uniref:Uncharacterized protein n=1 Tax=Penicillium citrinum TaxID=5077 RepID=A0A9W9PAB5_PENCI|nr:uncharacterized protein N7469_002313 [Penicillium citrinum]KAJ5240722.1 hypothetical protein N7469_002313 [Penicillium citrinum]
MAQLSTFMPLQTTSALVGRTRYRKTTDASRYNKDGQAALSLAIMQGNLPFVQNLLRQPDVDINGGNPKYQPPILEALEYQRYDVLKMLLQDPRIDSNIQNGQGYTALHLAIIYDDLVALQMLLDHTHIDINYLDSSGNSALLLAAMTYDGRNPKREAIIDVLVSHPKTSVDIQDHRGRSVLWHAANTSNRRLILQLARLPATDLEAPDDNGVTPSGQSRK